jgi:hypothetical protein
MNLFKEILDKEKLLIKSLKKEKLWHLF